MELPWRSHRIRRDGKISQRSRLAIEDGLFPPEDVSLAAIPAILCSRALVLAALDSRDAVLARSRTEGLSCK